MIDEQCDWDEDAIEEALRTANDIEDADPETAHRLRAQAEAAARRRDVPIATVGKEPYDPMKVYARVAKYYGWSHEAIDMMHFVTLFGYVREMHKMNEDEKAEYDRARRNGTQATAAPTDGVFPVAHRYEGETVALS